MKINFTAYNPLTKSNVEIKYTIDYCDFKNEYVAHRNCGESTHSAGRYESYEDAFNGVMELTRKCGFKLKGERK